MGITKENYLDRLFIDDVKHIIHRGDGGGEPAVIEPLNVTENGTYNPPEGVDGFKPVDVNVPGPVLEPLNVTENGTYNPPEGVDGFDEVKVEIVDPPIGFSLQDFINITKSCRYIFSAQKKNDTGGFISNGSDKNSGWTDSTVARVLTGLDMSLVEDTIFMFHSGTITTLPSFDMSNVKDAYGTFESCGSLLSLPSLDLRSAFCTQYMFRNCTKLPRVEIATTSELRYMPYMFYKCESIAELPLFDTSNVVNMECAFMNCDSITELPLYDTRQVTNMYNFVQYCKSLTTVPALDTRSVTKFGAPFSSCPMLTEIWIRNIKASLPIGSNYYTNTLTIESIIHIIYELRDTGSVKTLTVGSNILSRLADVYVKTIDVTDEMRAEDDLVDEKMPFVVCESTDEGATLITEYVLFKNWKIA